MSSRADQSNAAPVPPIPLDYGTDVAPTPFNCRRCEAPCEKPGMCKGCADAILGRSQKSRDQRVKALYEERVGPQTSFWIMACLVWPLSFAVLLIITTFTKPEFSIAQTALWSLLLSSGGTAFASWLLLFWPVFQKDPMLALLALRAPARLYRHADHLRAVAPLLFGLHFVALGVAIFTVFMGITTATFRPDQLGGVLGYRTTEVCTDARCSNL